MRHIFEAIADLVDLADAVWCYGVIPVRWVVGGAFLVGLAAGLLDAIR